MSKQASGSGQQPIKPRDATAVFRIVNFELFMKPVRFVHTRYDVNCDRT